MPVRISEVAAIHEAMIFNRIDVAGAAVFRGRLIHGIDIFTRIARNHQRDLARGFRWNGASRKRAPFGMSQKHDVD